jgi:phosphate transport system substrate-binding protein
MKDKNKAKAIADFLKWAVSDGQKYTKDLYYAPLPKEVVKLDDKKISTIALK